MESMQPTRKPLRLKAYDYSTNGAYFITVCTHKREPLFAPVGADSISARMVERTFVETINRYPMAEAPINVVMPNHFHALITISRADMESAPTLSEIVQSFKRYFTLEYIKLVKKGLLPLFDKRIWQRSFYDHVIRDERDFEEKYNYILANPSRWCDDELYCDAIK